MRKAGGNSGFWRAGFTLVEVGLVLLLVGVLAAMAVPRYMNSLNNYRASMAAKRVAADLALARNDAWATGARRTVMFIPGTNEYQLQGVRDVDRNLADTTVNLAVAPYAATLVSADFRGEQTVVFDGYGVPVAAGQVVVSSGSCLKTVVIDGGGGARVP